MQKEGKRDTKWNELKRELGIFFGCKSSSHIGK
jgi:hypothetical protein